MKNKIIAILLSLVMVSGCSVETTEVEQEEALVQEKSKDEPEEIVYLTDKDFSLLYTYRPEVRIADPYDFTQDEATLIMKVAAHESQGVLGQLAVMCVIVNRIKSKQFPDTVGEVVFQSDQFVTARNLNRVEINVDTHIALSLLEKGVNNSQGALYFESSSNSPNSWHAQNLTFLFELCGNKYYK